MGWMTEGAHHTTELGWRVWNEPLFLTLRRLPTRVVNPLISLGASAITEQLRSAYLGPVSGLLNGTCQPRKIEDRK
jgi:hypothetical protein